MNKQLRIWATMMSIPICLKISMNVKEPLIAEAIPLETRSFCNEFVQVEGSPVLTVKGVDGKSYPVYYAKEFAGCGATVNQTNYYNRQGLNIFYRRTYAKDDPKGNKKDENFFISYQLIPEATYRSPKREYYTWNWMYEDRIEHLPTWRNSMVDRNSLYCGLRESGFTDSEGDYISPLPWTCAGTGNSKYGNSTVGQVSNKVGFNDEGIWTGISEEIGEARYIGYNEYGHAVINSYFANDYPINYNVRNYKYDEFAKVQNKYVQPTAWDTAKKGSEKYNLKVEAIKRLMKQENLDSVNSSVDYWMKRFSLQNNPVTEAAIFKASGWGGGYYIAIALDPPKEADRNLGVESFKILDSDGTAISTMTRTVGTTKYLVDQHKTKKAEAGQTYQIELVIKNSSFVKSVSTNHSIQFKMESESEWVVKNASQTGVIQPDGTVKVTFNYQIPVDSTGQINLHAKINDAYKKAGDNTFMDDDTASLAVNVQKAPEGDLSLKKVYLVDVKQSSSDKLVYAEYPIQGVEYFVLYEIEYKGENMKGAEFTIGVDSVIDRHKVNSATGSLSSSQVPDLINGKYPSTKTKLDKGKVIYVKGQTFTATTSKIIVDATLVLGDYNYNYNNNTSNDSQKQAFYAPINLKVNKVGVNPNSHPGGDYCNSFTINYKVDFNWASHVTRPNSEVQKVKVAYSVLKPNSNTYVQLKTETIKVYANRQNQEYVAKIDNKCIPEGSKIKVTINSDYQLHEGNISDNSKEYTWQATVNRKDYCAQTKKTSTRWTQSYVVLERKEGGYSNLVDILKSASNPIKVSNSESYEITAIWMSSKLMKDKGYGSAHSEGAGSGWVNALNPARGEEVIIKAGYAFDFQIEVKYQTNAYQNEKNHSQLNNLPSNKDVYNRLEKLPLNDDLYMKTSDGKLVSLTSTDIRFEKSTVGSVEDELIITYQLASRLSPNGTGEEVDGLFVNEDTKDGTYYLDVYTAPIEGVSGKTTNEVIATNPSIYKPLCDNDRISFKVKGSYRDDLNIGLIK